MGVLSENRTQYVELDFGLLLDRRVRVALNARLHVDDFEYMPRDSDVELLIHSGDFAEAPVQLSGRLGIPTLDLDAPDGHEAVLAASNPNALDRPASEEDVASISYTSGTTGRPEGVTLSRRGLRHVAFNLLLELEHVRPGEQLILAQPLSHGAGCFVLPFLISGAGLVIQRKFDAGGEGGGDTPSRGACCKRRPGEAASASGASRAAAPGKPDLRRRAVGCRCWKSSLERFGPVAPVLRTTRLLREGGGS